MNTGIAGIATGAISPSSTTRKNAPISARSTRVGPGRKPKSTKSLSGVSNGAVPPSFLYDLDPNEQPGKTEPINVNYAAVGFGIFRVPAANGLGLENLILSYGPSASHGHPDKLHVDLFAFDDVLMPSPEIQYPYYNNPLLPNWYKTTFAHNTLVVDQGVQAFHEHSPRLPDVVADQTIYGPAETMGLQRAWTDTAYPGVHMDRAVFLNGWYFADLFSASPRALTRTDLAWHIRGAPTSSLPLSPTAFSDPVPVGYNQLTNVRQTQPTSDSWTMSLALKDHESRLVAAGGDATRALVGDGGVYADFSRGRTTRASGGDDDRGASRGPPLDDFRQRARPVGETRRLCEERHSGRRDRRTASPR